MTETLESVKAERDALALKLWRIATGRETATYDDLLRDTRELEIGVRKALTEATWRAVTGNKNANALPDYILDKVQFGIHQLEVRFTANNHLDKREFRVHLDVEMPKQTVSLVVNIDELAYYTEGRR